MDQYVRWRQWQTAAVHGATGTAGTADAPQYHDDFYTDEAIIGWYQDYASHLIDRNNSISGVRCVMTSLSSGRPPTTSSRS
jgi:mannan endo-1,4-beta-mannosidase